MKILAIGAHQDDNEFRVGGMARKWVKAGGEIAVDYPLFVLGFCVVI